MGDGKIGSSAPAWIPQHDPILLLERGQSHQSLQVREGGRGRAEKKKGNSAILFGRKKCHFSRGRKEDRNDRVTYRNEVKGMCEATREICLQTKSAKKGKKERKRFSFGRRGSKVKIFFPRFLFFFRDRANVDRSVSDFFAHRGRGMCF